MILGTGIDITSLTRMERSLAHFGERFVRRILSEQEQLLCPQGERLTEFLAGRWAAKEAFVKALGTGFVLGIGPKDIWVLRQHNGAPRLELSGQALEQFRKIGGKWMHVSISHDGHSAVAIVILEA